MSQPSKPPVSRPLRSGSTALNAPDPTNLLSKEAERAYIMGVATPAVSVINAPPPPLQKYDNNSARTQQQRRPPDGISEDKFSTPARRRRIVADVARFLLKQYCVKACVNVSRLRLETAKALVIQCAVRRALARERMKSLRFQRQVRCAWKIQMTYRMHRSLKEYKRRYSTWRLRLATTLSLLCQRFCRGIIARRLFRKKVEAHKKWLARRQNIAALHIQRVVRGGLGREKALYRRRYLENLHLRRAHATLVLQCASRRHRALIRVRTLRRRNNCSRQIKRRVVRWFRRLKAKRLQSAIIIQRSIRRLLATLRVIRLKAARDAARQAEHLRQLDLAEIERLRLLELAELERIRNLPPPDPEPTMEVRIIVNLLLLQHMASLGPVVVLEWCLHNFILKYDTVEGYSFGRVLFQVVNAVEGVMPEIHKASDLSLQGSPIYAEHQKSIKLSQWDYGNDEVCDVAYGATFPQKWNQQHRVSDEGAKIFVEWKSKSIDVHLIFPADHKGGPAQHFHLLLEAEDENGALLITPAEGIGMSDLFSLDDGALGGGESDRRRKQFFEDVRFKFRNALVFVPLQQRPPTPIPDLKDEEEESQPVENESYRLVAVESRPVSRAKIIVSVPEPPPIDYDRFATVIQRMVGRWFGLRVRSANRIKRRLRSYALVRKWRILVFIVYGRAVQKSIILQRYFRRHLACKVCDKRRIEHCIDLVRGTHTFLLSSLLSSDLSPLLAHTDAPPDEGGCYMKIAPVSGAYGWAAPLLELLEVKEPPPGCMRVADRLYCLGGAASASGGSEFNDVITPRDKSHANANKVVEGLGLGLARTRGEEKGWFKAPPLYSKFV